MNWKINAALLVFLFASCQPKGSENQEEVETEIKSKYLIEVEDLKELINEPNVQIIDFRKKEFYDQGHITGAHHLWRPDIEDASYPYGGMMAGSAQIEALFSRFGIQNNDMVVIYDDNGLCDAARLWWVLQNYDFNNVKMLHGGFSTWVDEQGSTTIESTNVSPTAFSLPVASSRRYYISKEEILDLDPSQSFLIDTRNTKEYAGEMQKKGAAKAGRIPNSIHQDWAESVDYNRNKKFKSLEELSALYEAHNLTKDDQIVVYCHSGVRSAHTTFVLTQLLGYKNVKNYDGSWTEWSHFDELNFVKDSLTTDSN